MNLQNNIQGQPGSQTNQEYVLDHGKISLCWGKAHPCFICERQSQSNTGYNLIVLVPDQAAGQRVVALFRPGATYLEQSAGDAYPSVFIYVCRFHRPCLEALAAQVWQSGVLSSEFIISQKCQSEEIYRQTLRKMTEERANQLWLERERPRREQDWFHALNQLINELGHFPSPAQRTERARRLHEQRKGSQAIEDWLDAERKFLED